MSPDRLYLRAGWVRSEGGLATLGGRWLPSGDYMSVISGAEPRRWVHYARVNQPPPGTERSPVWLLNTDSAGRVLFDNVLFVDLGRHSPTACQAGEPKGTRCGTPLSDSP